MEFRRPNRRRIRAMLDMTPLVNCVLLLLIFFMLSSTFTVRGAINVQMPVADSEIAYEQKDMSITLAYGPGGPDGKGPIYVDDVEVAALSDLTRLLAEAAAKRPDLRLLIRPDARVESGRLVEVLGIAHSVGIQRYGIAAQPTSVGK